MINPKDLRLGNFVKVDEIDDFAFEIVNICANKLSFHGEPWGRNPEHVEGIVITVDILLKCGFKVDEFEGETAALWNIRVGNWTYFGSFNYERHSVRFDILHNERQSFVLHDLQNRFYYITGHELKVKL